MKRSTALLRCLSAFALCAACSAVYAMYDVENKGTWPRTWPAELEPLRKQSRTLVGPMLAQPQYEIPFTTREDFESAWPHLLKVKTKGAPLILVRSPSKWPAMKAGVFIHGPAPRKDAMPEGPLPGEWAGNVREQWMHATVIELIVDGQIVDLNRIALPADTLIVDERFKEADQKP